MSLKSLLFSAFFFIIPTFIWSQTFKLKNMYDEGRSTYFTMYGGPSKYLGDLGNQDVGLHKLTLPQATFFGGIGIQRFYKRKFSFQVGFCVGSLKGADNTIHYTKIGDDDYFRFRRNLDFKSIIKEGSLTFNVYGFQFLNKESKLYNSRFQPYLTGGIGIFNFNPKGSYFDQTSNQVIWIDLQPLSTEGEGLAEYPDRKNYALTQSNFLYGAGLLFYLSNNWLLSFEVVGRKLHTDYLDDVSTTYVDKSIYNNYYTIPDDIQLAQTMSDKSNLVDPYYHTLIGETRGNPKKNDAYFTYNLKVAFKIKSKKSKQANFYKYDDTEICN